MTKLKLKFLIVLYQTLIKNKYLLIIKRYLEFVSCPSLKEVWEPL